MSNGGAYPFSLIYLNAGLSIAVSLTKVLGEVKMDIIWAGVTQW